MLSWNSTEAVLICLHVCAHLQQRLQPVVEQTAWLPKSVRSCCCQGIALDTLRLHVADDFMMTASSTRRCGDAGPVSAVSAIITTR